jgi:uncharacterized protein
MATTYKTPGVFIEEIPKLPPSVAQVETAIPAFIGYTLQAEDQSPNDLLNVPRRISSLVEFEQYYGGGPSPIVTEVNIDSNNNFVSAKVSNRFFMYDSLRMFYANGGGDCFIVSVGISENSTTIAASAFTAGLTALEKEDAPTILLFPDAVMLSDGDIATVQQAALKQCNDLQDRVGLFDVRQNDPLGTTFKNNIGINFLKYGAVYTPWLKVNLPKDIRYTDVESVIKKAGIGATLTGLTTDTEIQDLITAVEQAYADRANIDAKTKLLSAPNGILSDGFSALVATFNGVGGNNDGNLQNLFDYVYAIGAQIEEFINGGAPDELTLPDFLSDVTNAVVSNFDPAFAKVVALNLEADADIPTYGATDFTAMVTAADWPQSVIAVASADIKRSQRRRQPNRCR